MRAVSGLALLLVIGFTGVGLRTARGEACGVERPCDCGDTLTGRSYVLPADLGPCPGDGLVLRGGAVLDCGGFTIRGAEPPSGSGAPRVSVGIVLDQTDGAVVRNCSVTGFRSGIELREARRSTISDATVFRNGDVQARMGYGIHMNRAEGNTVRNCFVRDNADEGIHVGSQSNDNALIANSVYDNGREDLYVLSARGTRLLQNRAGGKVSAALYMKHVTMSRVEGNHLERPAVIRGRSSGNVFVDNVFDAGLSFRVADGADAAGPSANLVRGGRISGGPACIAFFDASENRIEAVAVADCKRISAYSSGPTTNHFVAMPLERIALDLSGGATLRLLGPVHVVVSGTGGSPISGAQFSLRDGTGATYDGPVTDKSGGADLLVPTHVVTAVSLVPLSPVRVSLSAAGYAALETILSDPLPTRLDLSLEASD